MGPLRVTRDTGTWRQPDVVTWMARSEAFVGQPLHKHSDLCFGLHLDSDWLLPTSCTTVHADTDSHCTMEPQVDGCAHFLRPSRIINKVLTIMRLLELCMRIGTWYLTWCHEEQANKSSGCAGRFAPEGYSSHSALFESVATYLSTWLNISLTVLACTQVPARCYHRSLCQDRCLTASSQPRQARDRLAVHALSTLRRGNRSSLWSQVRALLVTKLLHAMIELPPLPSRRIGMANLLTAIATMPVNIGLRRSPSTTTLISSSHGTASS